jgi:hypothetical protein
VDHGRRGGRHRALYRNDLAYQSPSVEAQPRCRPRLRLRWWLGNPPHAPFVLAINNYGRTPATLIEYAVEFCEFGAIPARPAYLAPDYGRTRVSSHVYPPGARAVEVDHIPYRDLQDPRRVRQVLVRGRLETADFASFILSLPRDRFPSSTPRTPTGTDEMIARAVQVLNVGSRVIESPIQPGRTKTRETRPPAATAPRREIGSGRGPTGRVARNGARNL